MAKTTEKKTPAKKATAKKDTTHLNPAKLSATLIKNGYLKDDYGILTSADDKIVIKFNLRSVQIVAGELRINVPTSTNTNADFIACLKSAMAGKKPTMTKTAKLTVPAGYATFMNELAELEKAAKKVVAEKKASKKAADKPKAQMVVNPNKDGSAPIFDMLNVAVTETEKAENVMQTAWSVLASQFNYSIKEITAALHAEGKWANKINSKTNEPILDPNGFYQAAGYKAVYDAEKASGIKGVGHMVNTASRMFARYSPALEKARAEAAANKEANKASKSSDTLQEKDVDKILIEMSKLAKKLNTSDLKSWLESDPSVTAIWSELSEVGPDDLEGLVEDEELNELAGLDDEIEEEYLEDEYLEDEDEQELDLESELDNL